MKKFIFILALLFIQMNSFAQKDSVVLQITYQANYKGDRTFEDVERLDIGEYSSRFYSLIGEHKKNRSKGINNGPMPYKGSSSNYDVFKNIPQKGIMEYIHQPLWLTVKDSIDNLFNWKLEEGDTTVCEYPCKKASTDFRGRKWNVWYTPELPYSDGPWKLCGLPGIILYAQDSKGEAIFNVIEIKQAKDAFITYPNERKRYVTPKRAEELRAIEHQSGVEYFNQMMAGGIQLSKPNGNRGQMPDFSSPALELFKTNK